jgi:hypothetical protein
MDSVLPDIPTPELEALFFLISVSSAFTSQDVFSAAGLFPLSARVFFIINDILGIGTGASCRAAAADAIFFSMLSSSSSSSSAFSSFLALSSEALCPFCFSSFPIF